MVKFKIPIFLCLCFVVINPILSQNNTDWSNPDNINPLDKNIGDFLDVNLRHYSNSAAFAYMNKNYKEAAQYYLYTLRYTYNDAETIYQLARCYGMLSEYELASKYIIRAVNAGYTKFEYIEKDESFSSICKTAVFKKTISEIKKHGKKFGKAIYFKGTKMNKCRVKLPDNYNSEKTHTLIVGLHGNGGNADNFIKIGDYIKDDNIIFASPQGPYLKALSNNRMKDRYSWSIQIRDIKLWERGDYLSVDYIVNAVKYISSEYNIDKVYLLGFSEGAAYTYITGIKYPDLFNGIICIGGRLPSTEKPYSLFSEEDIKKSRSLKVFIAHGLKDKVLKIEYGKKAKTKLKKNAYDITFYTYDAGHTIPGYVMEEVVKWINSDE